MALHVLACLMSHGLSETGGAIAGLFFPEEAWISIWVACRCQIWRAKLAERSVYIESTWCVDNDGHAALSVAIVTV